MKRALSISCLWICLLVLSSSVIMGQDNHLDITPTPQSLVQKNGHFTLNSKTSFAIGKNQRADLKKVGGLFPVKNPILHRIQSKYKKQRKLKRYQSANRQVAKNRERRLPTDSNPQKGNCQSQNSARNLLWHAIGYAVASSPNRERNDYR